MRGLKIVMVAVSVATGLVGSATPAGADALFSCSVNYSGVDARRSCSYVSGPWLSHLIMEVDGYAFAVLTCSGMQVKSTGVVGSGSYEWYPLINPGGSCTLSTGVNGSLYAHSD